MNTKSEVILSAGAIVSPQLLMITGIGSAYHLRAHGIPVVYDQPMMVQGMSDNQVNLLFAPSHVPAEDALSAAWASLNLVASSRQQVV